MTAVSVKCSLCSYEDLNFISKISEKRVREVAHGCTPTAGEVGTAGQCGSPCQPHVMGKFWTRERWKRNGKLMGLSIPYSCCVSGG